MTNDLIREKGGVRHSNAITNSFLPFTKQESKLFVCILAGLKAGKLDYTFSVSQIMKMLQLPSNRYSELVHSVDALYEKSIPIMHPDDIEEIRLFDRKKYPKIDKQKMNGTLEISIARSIEPHLMNLKANFTHYEIESYLRLGSVNSQKLYTLLAQFKSTGILIRSFDQLQSTFGTSYKNLSNFKQKILDNAIDEVKELTNINRIKLEPLKEGRKITGYKFLFKWNQQLDIFNKEEVEEILDFPPVVNRLAKRLIDDFKLSQRQAFDLLATLSPEDINKELYELNIQLRSGKIDNIGAYTVTIFRDKYGVIL